MSLSSEEVERYARQIVLRGVGGPGQNKLKAARALVVGAGGLGSPALQYLAGAGVGTLGIVDDDEVALSNLHRQIIHGTDDVGRPKTESAADGDRPHQSACRGRADPAAGWTQSNARAIVRRFDVVLDGSDNFATRYALSDACFYERRPLVSAALGEFDGTLTTLKPYEKGADGRLNPTYRCLFPDPPEPGTIPTCAEAGVLGALGGVLGSLMALEAIREIVGGFGDGDEGLVGRLLMIDSRAMRFETLRYGWDPDNPLSGSGRPPRRQRRRTPRPHPARHADPASDVVVAAAVVKGRYRPNCRSSKSSSWSKLASWTPGAPGSNPGNRHCPRRRLSRRRSSC